MIDAYPRPVVSAEEYRELETLAMQRFLQLPLQDLGKCLIAIDLEREYLRRWLTDKRLKNHQPADTLTQVVNDGNVVRMFSGD